MNLDQRRIATQATRDQFVGKPLDWAAGRHCVKMAHVHARRMGARVPPLPRVRSPLGARKALKANGWGGVTAMLDSLFERIAPARMLLGDMAVTPGDEGMDSVMICLGPRRMLGFLPDGSEVVAYEADLNEFTAAWRVTPASSSRQAVGRKT
ncbi:MAG: hypothetical protein J2O44_07760 [Porphyrobacter sp.]|nr:hypothetical protein [Porphyrobacter sp.]